MHQTSMKYKLLTLLQLLAEKKVQLPHPEGPLQVVSLLHHTCLPNQSLAIGQ